MIRISGLPNLLHHRAFQRTFRLLVISANLCLLCFVATAQQKPGSGKNAPPAKKMPSQEFKGYGLPEAVKKPPTEIPKVAGVDKAAREERIKVAKQIDDLIAAKLAKHEVSANSKADDYTFVRRAFLDVTGTIPTMIQTNAYASEKSSQKAYDLVDGLLSSPGYVSHFYNYWASILRITDRTNNNNILSYPYRDWVKDQLRTNRPFDKWVYDMLTAEGKCWENPAVGYELRDTGMPLVHVDNTVRVFLGTQIGCAQCHDHPFDKWQQKQFYELAAFTAGTRTRDVPGTPAFENGNPINRIREEATKLNQDRLAGSKLNLLQANLARVSENPKRKLNLPHDYQYDNGKPNQPVKANVLWGQIPTSAAKLSPREQFGAWVTSPDNPLFAKTIANRLWKQVMGLGLIEPVDDLREDSPCQNPELLNLLTAEMIRLKFNQKEFLRTLMYTETYRREVSNYDPSKDEAYHFPGPVLRRMTAEQVWDSVLTIAVYNSTPYQLPSTEDFSQVVNIDLAKADYKTVEEKAKKFDEAVGPRGRNAIMNKAAYRKQVLARASELPSPLPADHFIRQFGQCDRETIEGDSREPTVPQILTMFNGPFTHMMLERGSVIYDNLTKTKSSREAVDVMFLSILNRPPNSQDREIAMREMARGDTAMGYGNVVWALINTREFLFIK